MGIFNRKKSKDEKSKGNGSYYSNVARDLNKFSEEGNFDKEEDAVLFITTAKNSGNTLIMGKEKNLTKCLVYAMSQDSNFFELVRKSLSIHDAMEKSKNLDLNELKDNPEELIDKLKSIFNNESVSAKIVDASDPSNFKEISLDELESNLISDKKRGLNFDDILKESGIDSRNIEDFNDDIESLGED